MHWADTQLKSLNLIEFTQDTSKKKWYSQGIEEYASFFYLLQWKSEGIFKFGYKLSRDAFREDYARYNHKIPDHSKIWLAHETNRKTKHQLIRPDYVYYLAFVKKYEAIVHRNLKVKFKKLKLYKEVYFSIDTKVAEEVIRRSLIGFNFCEYQNYSNKRTDEAIKKFSF
jgi:hypothetical protein